MKKPRYLLFAAFATLLLGLPFSAGSQQATSDLSPDQVKLRHHFAVKLLRVINAAEAEHNHKQGSYASWDVLRTSADFSQQFLRGGSVRGMQLYDRPEPGPEIFPGWSLRLNFTADGKGYDLILEDLTDETCGYALVTDERGIIRQSKTIDCAI
jgi:hypothetical protein